jgi:hypothetical protein
MLKMSANGTGEHDCLKVATFTCEIGDRVAV